MNGPKTVYFYTTSYCNSNCSFCTFRKSNDELPRIHMPYADITKFWANSEYLRKAGVVLQGGEFTEHPDAVAIAAYMHGNTRKVTLLTNCINPFVVDKFDPFVHQITISLDGPNHDKLRGAPGNLDTILWYIKNRKAVAPVNLQMTLGPWNAKLEQVQWFVRTAEDYNCGVRFNVAEDVGILGNGNYVTNRESLSEIANYLGGQLGSDNMSVRYLRLVASGLRPKCKSLEMYSTIMPNGDVMLCQGLPENVAKNGNLHETPFDKIWAQNKDKRQEYESCKRCWLSCQVFGDMKSSSEVQNG